MLLHCWLIDLGFHENIFTWNNGRGGDAFVQARLDCACANVRWREIFPHSRVTHVQSSYLNHVPLVITTHNPNQPSRRKKIPRRFEEKCLSHPECGDIIRNSWANCLAVGNPMFSLFEKIKVCRMALLGWGHTIFGNAKTRLEEKHKTLENLVSQNDLKNLEDIRKLKNEINQLIFQDELF